MDQKAKYRATMARLEKDYQRLRNPDVMVALKASTLDDLWTIFGTSVVTPEAAYFVVGRIYQAFGPYRDAMLAVAEYEEAESRLAAIGQREDAIRDLEMEQAEHGIIG